MISYCGMMSKINPIIRLGAFKLKKEKKTKTKNKKKEERKSVLIAEF